MSRFSFVLIATIFASLFLASCEKETFTPTNTASPAKFAEAEMALQLPTITVAPATERAMAMYTELSADPVLTALGTYFTVTNEMPVEKNLRYLESGPDAIAQENATAALDIDCPYGDCATTVPDIVAKYQEIANAQCNDQFLSITCCAEGETTYIVVHIKAACLPAHFR